jgi:cell shape-determining protein MreD
MRIVSWILFIVVVFVEGSLTTMPLTLIFLLCLTVMKRHEWILPLAFMSGIILDIFSFRPIGISSLFFITYIFLLLMYQRKYETATLPFVIIAAMMGSILYLIMNRESSILIQGIISTALAGVCFTLYRNFTHTHSSEGFKRV